MILERENYWCGRYVLILKDTIYMDAVGAMSIYYHDEYISDSLNLLRELLHLPLKKEKLFDELRPDFVPGPLTRYDGVRRLLPSMSYDFQTKTVMCRALMPEYPVEFESREERIRIFADELTQCMKNLDRYYEGKTKLITATGGKDSRTVLSASARAGLSYDTFILENDGISDEDVKIPEELSKVLGRKHYYIKQDKSRMSTQRLSDFDRHTCNYEKGADRMFYGYGQFEDLRDQVGGDIVILRGAAWEITSEFYGKLMKETFEDSMNAIFPLLPYQPLYRQSVDEWMDFVKNDPLNREIDLTARIYWDLRAGCWLSGIEQAFDIYDGITSVLPINCRRLISLLMGFDKEERTTGQHEIDITNFACPALAAVPYDFQIAKESRDHAVKLYKDYAQKAWLLLIHFGPGALIRFVKNKSS